MHTCITSLLSPALPPPPVHFITEKQAELHVLYSIFPLAIYFTHGSAWQPTPVFLLGESHGRSRAWQALEFRGSQESDNLATKPPPPLCTYVNITLSICLTIFSPCCVKKSVLYVCISIPALQIGSSVPFFQILYIYIYIYMH